MVEWPSSPVAQGVNSDLVPLEAHIISKCPDTRDALRQLLLPVMQRVSDKVDFRLSYIGKQAPHDGVECLHGPSECMGNIIELCARELYPDPKLSLGFVMCLTKDYKHIPERTLVEDCALEHAIDFEKLNECATRDDGAHGLEMLKDSVQRTADVGSTSIVFGYRLTYSRPTSPRAALSVSITKSTASATAANGLTAPTAPV